MSDQYPSRVAEKIVVRLPDGMRDRLAAAAKNNKRSTNAEVVARLERSFGSEEITEELAKWAGASPSDDLVEVASKLLSDFNQGVKTLLEKARSR